MVEEEKNHYKTIQPQVLSFSTPSFPFHLLVQFLLSSHQHIFSPIHFLTHIMQIHRKNLNILVLNENLDSAKNDGTIIYIHLENFLFTTARYLPLQMAIMRSVITTLSKSTSFSFSPPINVTCTISTLS